MSILYDIDDLETKKILDDFLEAIQVYLTSPKYGSSKSANAKEGLKIFHNLPFVLSSTLFLLNDETYDFEHILTYPNTDSEKARLKYDKYVDNRLIDSSFSQGSIFVDEKDPNSENDFRGMLVPMIVSWGIIGAVVLEINEIPTDHLENFKKVCGIHGRIFASVLERVRLFDKLHQANEKLSEKIKVKSADLLRSQEEFTAIFQNVPVGIILLNDEINTIHKANPKSIEMLSLQNEEEIEGRDLNDFFEFKNWDLLEDDNIETNIKTELGINIPVLCQIKRVSMDNELFKIISIMDITSRKNADLEIVNLNSQLEENIDKTSLDLEKTVKKLEIEVEEKIIAEKDLKKKLDQEKELNEMKSSIVNNVSHEFRTPLTAIRNTTQILESYGDKMDSDKKSKQFDMIYGSVDFMIDLLENSLYLSDSNEAFKDELQQLDLKLMIDHIISEQKKKLDSDHEFILTINNNSRIKFQRKPLSLIISNLISNSIKYSPDGTLIKINVSIFESNLTISTKDNGNGIPKRSQKLIFEPFYRANNVGASSGTGLGLTVVKNIVERFKGEISFTSSEKGSHFIITIPLEKDE